MTDKLAMCVSKEDIKANEIKLFTNDFMTCLSLYLYVKHFILNFLEILRNIRPDIDLTLLAVVLLSACNLQCAKSGSATSWKRKKNIKTILLCFSRYKLRLNVSRQTRWCRTAVDLNTHCSHVCTKWRLLLIILLRMMY